MRKLVTLGAVAVSLVGVALQASAAVTTTNVTGTNGRAEQTCLSVIPLFTDFDCTVSGWPDLGLAFADAQLGPLQSGGFYAPGTAPDVAVGSAPGDGKVNLAYSGSVEIDDNGTAGTGDDLVSFTLVLGAGARNTSTSGGSVTETWDSITQTLSGYAVDSAVDGNAFGGTDYVIGSAGMVLEICTPDLAGMPGTGGCLGDSEYGSTIGNDPLLNENPWTRFGPPGWSPGFPLPTNSNYSTGGAVNQNAGATTSAVVANYTCTDTGGLDPDCAPVDGVPEDGFAALYGNGGAEWDNLVMRISTDGAGNVVEARGFYVNQYDIILGGTNSWIGGSFNLQVVPVPAAVWLFGSALGLLGWMRRRTVA